MRPRLLLAPAGLGLAGATGAWALHVRDPHVAGAWGTCPFLWLTGLPCAGCGGLRAVHHLTDGDVGAALGSNALAVAVVVLLGVLWVRWTVRRARGADVPIATTGNGVALLTVAVFVAFGVARNTPWGAALAP